MKLMIVGAIVLGAGSAAVAGYVAMQSSEEAAVAESDSSQVAVEELAPDEQAANPMDSLAVSPDSGEAEALGEVAVADSATQTPNDDYPVVEVASAVQPPSIPEPEQPDPEAQRQAYRQVARILSNMGDAEVGQLLAHITDEEIELILRNVTAREGARILSQLSGERAAALSRRLMVAATSSGGNN